MLPDHSETSIAFASCTLTTSESNCSQLEREALSLIFGIQKFHWYLYGQNFTLVTDHKPLTIILRPKKGIPSLAAARLQKWAMQLAAYDYVIHYKPTTDHGNDCLSRLPLPSAAPSCNTIGRTTFNIGQLQSLPVTARDIEKATRWDATIGKVYRYVWDGWPSQVKDEFKPYQNRLTELTIEGGCLMWGIWVVIPKGLQPQVLKSLHANHPGISQMKAITRRHFWWEGLDKEIKMLGKSCQSCQSNQSNPSVAPLHPWVWPGAPWEQIHVNFAGPFLGYMFLQQLMRTLSGQKSLWWLLRHLKRPLKP